VNRKKRDKLEGAARERKGRKGNRKEVRWRNREGKKV
jgi:hypothetical protein